MAASASSSSWGEVLQAALELSDEIAPNSAVSCIKSGSEVQMLVLFPQCCCGGWTGVWGIEQHWDGNTQISSGIWISVPKVNSILYFMPFAFPLCFPLDLSALMFHPCSIHCWSLARGFFEQHHFASWDSGIGFWGPGNSLCTQNGYSSSIRDLLCLINSLYCKCQLPLSPGSSIPVEGVAELFGSRWTQGCLFCVVLLFLLPFFHHIPAFLLWRINPGLSCPAQDWVSLARPVAGACSGEKPQPDPRSLNQQWLLPVTDWSFNGLKNRWIRKTD